MVQRYGRPGTWGGGADDLSESEEGRGIGGCEAADDVVRRGWDVSGAMRLRRRGARGTADWMGRSGVDPVLCFLFDMAQIDPDVKFIPQMPRQCICRIYATVLTAGAAKADGEV